MMPYVVKSTNNRHMVVEKRSSLIMKTFSNKSQAREFCVHLNLGNGFEGWSPSFMGLGTFYQPNKKGDYSLE